MTKLKNIIIFIIVFMFCSIYSSCQNDYSNQSEGLLRTNHAFIDVEFQKEYSLYDDIKAIFKYANTDMSYLTYEGNLPELGITSRNDLMRLVVLNDEKHKNLINNDGFFHSNSEFLLDLFKTQPILELAQYCKKEYGPLNEDIDILRKSPINIVRNDVIYNYKEEVEIPKSVLTNDSGRLYFVALFLMTNEDNNFNPEVFDCLFNIKNMSDIEKIEDDFDLQLYTGISPIVFDYKIVDNKIVFEYVKMDYKTY